MHMVRRVLHKSSTGFVLGIDEWMHMRPKLDIRRARKSRPSMVPRAWLVLSMCGGLHKGRKIVLMVFQVVF